jgi:V-ATPase subunit C
LTRKQTGNLASRSLVSVVDPKLLIQSSEYIETHLVAVPNSFVKDFLRSYETLSPMVVPRSANVVASDDEYTLYTVTTFKKHSPEFQHKAREKKWVPRDFKFKEGGKEEEAREVDRVGEEEKKVWGETLRLGRTGWSEGVMVLIHVIVLRVFVETVLRYGLPLDFVSALVKVRLDFFGFKWFESSKETWRREYDMALTYPTDNIETIEEGPHRPGCKFCLPGRKCIWQGQEGQTIERRLQHKCRYASSGSGWRKC